MKLKIKCVRLKVKSEFPGIPQKYERLVKSYFFNFNKKKSLVQCSQTVIWHVPMIVAKTTFHLLSI